MDDIIPALTQVLQDTTLRDVLIYLYTEQPGGARYVLMKDDLFLGDDFGVVRMHELVQQGILVCHDAVYMLSDDTRAYLTAHPEDLS
jgi:hypothetical protein